MTIDPRQDRFAARLSGRTLRLAAGVALAAVTVSALACGGGSQVTASVGVASSSAAPQSPLPRGMFGVQPGPTSFDEQDVAKIAGSGVGTVRVGFNWSWVQPQPGPFNWSRTDEQTAILAASGVASVPILAGSPPWIASEPTTPPLGSPERKEAWKAFVTAATRRYGPGGTFWRPGPSGKSVFHVVCGCDARPDPIKEWQVWNEPNLVHYYTPEPSPGAYARLLRMTRSAIKAADREAEVVLAGLSDGPSAPADIGAGRYLNRLYGVPGAARTFDAVAVHPYARDASGVASVIRLIRQTMRDHHDRRTPLWVTEVGWGSARPDGFGTTKGISGQRRIVKRTMKMMVHHRRAWRLQRVYWFFWRDPPKSDDRRLPCRICHSAGLLRGNHEPKPAYRVFARIARRAD